MYKHIIIICAKRVRVDVIYNDRTRALWISPVITIHNIISNFRQTWLFGILRLDVRVYPRASSRRRRENPRGGRFINVSGGGRMSGGRNGKIIRERNEHEITYPTTPFSIWRTNFHRRFIFFSNFFSLPLSQRTGYAPRRVVKSRS